MPNDPPDSKTPSALEGKLAMAAAIATVGGTIIAGLSYMKDSSPPPPQNIQTVTINAPPWLEQLRPTGTPSQPIIPPVTEAPPQTTSAPPHRRSLPTTAVSTRPQTPSTGRESESATPRSSDRQTSFGEQKSSYEEKTIFDRTPAEFCGQTGISADAWGASGQYQQKASIRIPGRDRAVILQAGEALNITSNCAIVLVSIANSSGTARITIRETPIPKVPLDPSSQIAKEQR